VGAGYWEDLHPFARIFSRWIFDRVFMDVGIFGRKSFWSKNRFFLRKCF
jgi:hypothetical protein